MKTGNFLISVSVLCCCIFGLLQSIKAQGSQQENGSFRTNPYWHRRNLDHGGTYQLEWLVDWGRERVIFNVTAATRGWVGFGLGKKSKMEGADIVIGGVSSNGRSYFSDRHAIGNQEPILDESQDWVLHSATQNRTHTFLSFSRPFDTCDPNDIQINDDAVFLMWAYGERDIEAGEYHFDTRGRQIVYLRDPDLTPRNLLEGNSDGLSNGTQIWNFRETFTIPPKRTTYWCNIKKFSPPTPGKKHLIGHRLRMNPEATTHMHHMTMYRCLPPLGLDPKLIYEPFINYPGNECYDIVRPQGLLPTPFCYDAKFGQAIGGYLTFFFPNDFGLSIGETNPEEYFLIQVHYDNPDLLSNVTAVIDFDFYYTPNLREHEGGVMTLGHSIPGSPSILVPPGEIDHPIFGLCSENCTRKMFPPTGIKVIGGMLHAHNAARGLRFQHFRNGRELPWILKDDNYNFAFQPWRLRRNEVTVMPGDQLTMRCNYGTTTVNETTVGGYSSNQEMCNTIFFYYNRLEDYAICRSEINSAEYMAQYLAGLTNVTWDLSRLEYAATAPPHLAGMTISQISDSPYVNWDMNMRSQLRRDHIVRPQVSFCPGFREGARSLITGISPPPEYVTYPVEAIVYRPDEQRCSVQGP